MLRWCSLFGLNRLHLASIFSGCNISVTLFLDCISSATDCNGFVTLHLRCYWILKELSVWHGDCMYLSDYQFRLKEDNMKPPKLTANFPDSALFCYECGREKSALLFLEESGKYLCRDCFRDSVELINDSKRHGDFKSGQDSYLAG